MIPKNVSKTLKYREYKELYLASLLCTTGGSCLGSPTKTNLSARKRGPREAGWRIWEASSMIQTSNRLWVNRGWVIPKAVVATTFC